jgi:hypothetical protein
MSSKSRPFVALSALVVALAASAPSAHAVTECVVTPGDLFVGGDPPITINSAYFFASWVEGGAGVVYQSDANYKPLLAVLMSAKLTHSKVRVRYLSDNTSCTAVNPGPISGIWML